MAKDIQVGRGPFDTIAQVRAANAQTGHYFFSRETMRFFNSRIESGLYGGRFFITSERREKDMPRKFTVRQALDDGRIADASTFQQFDWIEDARDFAKALVQAWAAEARKANGVRLGLSKAAS